MAIAWNHLQVELIERLGLDGLALARQLAMTTYRSEADFDERFGRDIEPDGRFSIVSYLDHQGEKLVERFDAATYRILAGAMDRHDVGLAWGGLDGAFARLAASGTRGHRDRHRGRHPLRAAPGTRCSSMRPRPRVRTLAIARSARSKGHDAFLVEWDQLDGAAARGTRRLTFA